MLHSILNQTNQKKKKKKNPQNPMGEYQGKLFKKKKKDEKTHLWRA